MTHTDLPRPDGIVFDMDGVLADESGSYRECIVRTVADFGCAISREDVEEAKRAGNANDDWLLTQALLAQRGVDVTLATVVRQFQTHYLGRTVQQTTKDEPSEAETVDGTWPAPLRELETLLIRPDLLKQMTSRFPCGIVTGRAREEAIWFLDRFGIASQFGMLIAMEDAPSKPSPDGIRMVMDKLGLRIPWMIGDTPDDMRAACAAGITPIGVLHAVRAAGPEQSSTPGSNPGDSARSSDADRASLVEAGAQLVLSDINDIEQYLA